jgi:DNA invertase Pin-like site-specific DNA recombinase
MTHDTSLKSFIYCRKSSEDDRQIASIGDQLRELLALAAREHLTLVAQPLTEEKSAKAPGRPVFNELLTRIERGEANAILCWDIDRLYRNPVDEGRARWLLQRGIIQQIRTPHRVFLPQDAGLLMSVEGGRAIDFIISLKKNVARGFRGKLEKGQRPGLAPPGYLNNTAKERGERDIIPDPDRFDLFHRGWDLMLSKQYSVRDIQQLAAHEWGLRSRATKKKGGRPYSISVWHNIFTNPFYAGVFRFKVPESDEYRMFQGAHVPMVSWEDFDRVQTILGRPNRAQQEKRQFPFTGMIRCGDCGTLVTAEAKYQIICPSCKTKFSARNKAACPNCKVAIDKMVNATYLHYTYYRCSKSRNPKCTQSIRSEELDRQIDDLLASVTISPDWLSWLGTAKEADSAREVVAGEQTRQSLERHRDQLRRRLAHINTIILSPETDWTLISHGEIKEEKQRLANELLCIEEEVGTEAARDTGTLELTEDTFRFGAYARFWFREGTPEQRRAILEGLSSNLKLNQKKLLAEPLKPLTFLTELVNPATPTSATFEPDILGFNNAQSDLCEAGLCVVQGWWNAIRTYWEENPLAKKLPQLKHPPTWPPLKRVTRGRLV